MKGAPEIHIAVVPEVLFLDTPENVATAEYFTQRSKHTLLNKYEPRGMKIHVIPGESDDPTKRLNGSRKFFFYSDYIEFLRTISAHEKDSD